MTLRKSLFVAACIAAFSAPAFADTNVTVLHVSENPAQRGLWEKIAADYNASHKGVNVQMKYLENEAFKAKLPTMLQSDSRPDLFYSWAGGVMQAQDKAGFLKDITADVATVDQTLSPTAVDAFKVDGKVVGVPFEQGEVVFYYNKKLFEKAGVKAEDIKSWDDFLAAVKKLKAAGITPIAVGAGEKWPMHFYYSYLVMRLGGEHALTDAKAGKDGGFKSPAFVDAGKRLRELAALEPFQPGYLQTSHAQSSGIFGDGKAAMDLMGQWLLGMQAPNSASGKGLPEEDIGILSFPVVAGGKGKATDTLGGINGWLVSKSAPPEAVDFLKFFSQEKYAKEAAASAAYIPVVKGADASFTNPLFKRLASDLAATTYHQNFFDQDLGPSVGRVINDVSVAVAAGEMTPEAAAAAIQEAADQQ
ncbi:carbohydrate ABC transporter substrate-binding protein (CUT1 family) [Roseiarcus fermentans]|uniref:Carbohydrate ABC transporter substrate-binding protein (CUT1 family) n=1 Tax=Roseiarcus fermentans TaxID=1473586 RepID=A0A366FQX2_9HYPH|nr:extracellular solute-binding protein [Roseiarcus fermentans]RBP16119.1 carbohydrate ABC transporter substrate-binding protein (CUT1 family) [Roseiarcus fermentans]